MGVLALPIKFSFLLLCIYCIPLANILFSIMVAGKDAMKNGPAAFSMAASEAYKKMGYDEKKLLKDSTISESEKTMIIKVPVYSMLLQVGSVSSSME